MANDNRSGPSARWVREPAGLFPNDDIEVCLVLFLPLWQVQRRQSIALSCSDSLLIIFSLPSRASEHFLSNSSCSAELPLFLFLSSESPTLSFCLLPPHYPLILSSLTLSGTYLWITNDNRLCSLMWEFCNQALGMTHWCPQFSQTWMPLKIINSKETEHTNKHCWKRDWVILPVTESYVDVLVIHSASASTPWNPPYGLSCADCSLLSLLILLRRKKEIKKYVQGFAVWFSPGSSFY